MHRAVAINGSPRMEKGNTARLLAAFTQGLEEAGSEVQTIYANRLEVKPCACGEMYCWYKKPGECCFQDDMQSLYPRLKQAQTLILATPVYIPLPSAMQSVVNRLCPLVKPALELRDGRTRARFHDDVEIERIVLVSTSGWWEIGNFGTVERIAQELAENVSVAYAGALLRPHASSMRRKGALTPDGEAVLQAARRAGNELVEQGTMDQETLKAVSRPLIGEEDLRRRYNMIV